MTQNIVNRRLFVDNIAEKITTSLETFFMHVFLISSTIQRYTYATPCSQIVF